MSDDLPIRWRKFQVVLTAVAMLAAGASGLYTYLVKDRLQQDWEAQRARLEEAWSRERQLLDLLPLVLEKMTVRDCDTNFAALVLVRELRRARIESGTEEAESGRASELAALRLVQSRLALEPGYCTCGTLTALAPLVQTGTDADVAEVAESISTQATRPGGTCGTTETRDRSRVEEVATTARASSYHVVFANDQTCEEALHSYSAVRETLAKELRGRFEPERLRIQSGRAGGRTWLVTAYGGNLTIEAASALMDELYGKPGIRDDIYWAKGATFTAQSRCTPPAA